MGVAGADAGAGVGAAAGFIASTAWRVSAGLVAGEMTRWVFGAEACATAVVVGDGDGGEAGDKTGAEAGAGRGGGAGSTAGGAGAAATRVGCVAGGATGLIDGDSLEPSSSCTVERRVITTGSGLTVCTAVTAGGGAGSSDGCAVIAGGGGGGDPGAGPGAEGAIPG